MKNKFLIIIGSVCFFLFFINYSYSQEEFYFEVTEIDITKNGNLIVGSKGGKAITNEGFEIIAENFGKWDYLPISRKSINKNFHKFSDRDLINRTSYLKLKCK